MERIVGEREGEKMRQGLIMVCAGCDTGAESGAYKVKEGRDAHHREAREQRRQRGGECVEERVRRVRGRVTVIDGG